MSTFTQVKQIIDRLDPYHLLASHAPHDEYDAESRKISERISVRDSAERIAEVIADVMQTAFGEPNAPARYQETAAAIRRALSYEYYGQISDQFEYGNISDGECIRLANAIILQTRTETDPDVLEQILNAVHVLVTHRSCADQLQLQPLTENWQRFDAASAEYLPDILAAADRPLYDALIRQILAHFPQIDPPA